VTPCLTGIVAGTMILLAMTPKKMDNFGLERLVQEKPTIELVEELPSLEQNIDHTDINKKHKTSISEEGLELIKKYEGFSSTIYNDVGAPAIGYGHRIQSKENYTKITEEKATEILTKDIEWIDGVISRNIEVKLNQNQYDAISSLIYNIGVGNFVESDLLEKLNKEDYLGAAKEFTEWKYSKGKVLPWLVSRRQKEYKLFLKDYLKES
jgi:lysozyme